MKFTKTDVAMLTGGLMYFFGLAVGCYYQKQEDTKPRPTVTISVPVDAPAAP